jgi:hypothetical protein
MLRAAGRAQIFLALRPEFAALGFTRAAGHRGYALISMIGLAEAGETDPCALKHHPE